MAKKECSKGEFYSKKTKSCVKIPCILDDGSEQIDKTKERDSSGNCVVKKCKKNYKLDEDTGKCVKKQSTNRDIMNMSKKIMTQLQYDFDDRIPDMIPHEDVYE